MNLYDVRTGDATLRVLTKSHNLHAEYFEAHGIECKKDWFKLPNQDVDVQWFKDRGCEEVSVRARAGDLVLWDSRTFHQGVESQKQRTEPNFRGVVYVCMTQRARASEKMQKKRRKAFDEGRLTSHLAHNCMLFPVQPWTRGKQLPDVQTLPKPALSAAALSLI